MKYIFELTSKADEMTSVEVKHEKVINGLKHIPSPWGIGEGEYPCPKFGTGITAIFNLNKFLKNGIKGDVMYSFRSKHSIESNDSIYMEFDPQKIVFNDILKSVKEYISFFEPYEASVFNKDIIFYDYENRGKYDLADFFRFNQVFFWNQEYCIKRVKMSLLDFKAKISGNVEYSELFMDGIIVIVTSNLLTLEESNEINIKLKALL